MEGRIYSALYTYKVVDSEGILMENFSTVLALFSSQDEAEKYINDFFNSNLVDEPEIRIVKDRTHLYKALVTNIRETCDDNTGPLTETIELYIVPIDIDATNNPINDINRAHCRKYAKYDF